MARFSKDENRQIEAAFVSLSHDASECELEQFVAQTLKLNSSQRSQKFPDGNPSADEERATALVSIAGRLSAAAQNAITKSNLILGAVVIKRVDQISGDTQHFVAGLKTYLTTAGEESEFIHRTQNIQKLRGTLARISNGLFLEALTAAILKRIYKNSRATQGSRDQGIDCLASTPILPVQSWCRTPDNHPLINYLGNNLHIVASCKANEGNVMAGKPDVISPAHVRELIGAWLIQRSSAGAWQKISSISLLAPIQLLLSTTYRLSDDSLSLCTDLGVTVWSIPDLIYLIIRHAPDEVFPSNSGFQFDRASFETWVSSSDSSRISRQNLGGRS